MLAATSSYNMTDSLSVTASLIGLVDFATRVVRGHGGASVNRRPIRKDQIDFLGEVKFYADILKEVAQHTLSTSQRTQQTIQAGIPLCVERLHHLEFVLESERRKLAPKGVEKAVIGFIRSVNTLRDVVME